MSEIYTTPSSGQTYLSAKKIREMKKKALQSYKKITTIKQKSDNEKKKSSLDADRELENFIQKT